MRLPTYKLKRRDHRGNVEQLIVNQTDYHRRLAELVSDGWKRVGERHGDAPDAVVDFMSRQDEKEIARERNPNHAAHGDAERTYEARQARPEIWTDPAPPSVGVPEQVIENPVVDTGPTEVATVIPIKRGPGRPRKNPLP